MTKTPKPRCAYKNESGVQCRAYPTRDSLYCVGHARHLGVLPTTKPEPVIDMVDAGVIPVVLNGDWRVNVEPEPVVTVDEPEALKVLRSATVQIELGGGIDPVLATQLSNVLRPYFGLTPMDGIELARVADRRMAADEQVARAQAAKLELIERSHELILDQPNEQERARVEAKVAHDIELAANDYRTKTDMMKRQLIGEPREAVAGTGEDEVYVVNGVKIVVPAEGMWSVPKTIAGLHRERLHQRKEKQARSNLMQSVPEYSQVYQKMAEIDRQFGSRSQLGGGQSQESSDFLVAEEIK